MVKGNLKSTLFCCREGYGRTKVQLADCCTSNGSLLRNHYYDLRQFSPMFRVSPSPTVWTQRPAPPPAQSSSPASLLPRPHFGSRDLLRLLFFGSLDFFSRNKKRLDLKVFGSLQHEQ